MTEDVLVIGGGIGGLAAALALARAGRSVAVLEQAPRIAEVGAGIQISPNGMRVLDALGVVDAVRAGAPRAKAVALRDGPSGRVVLRLDLSRLAAGDEYRFVHRADLIEALRAAALDAGASIRLGAAVEAVATDGTITLRGGEAIPARLVIGADGVRSVVRPALNGPARPFFTGQVAWRAVVPNTIACPSEAHVHMGSGRHLVSYPLRGGTHVNLVAVEERATWADEGWTHADDPEALRAAFAGFGGDAARLLAQVNAVNLWGLFRHPVAARWHGGRLVLLGDAAHPTLPFLAQGANLALEDAWVLAACLKADPHPGRAPARYQALRRPRAARVIAAANGNAWKYHLRAPLRGPAHLAMGLLGRLAPGRMVRGFDWLYGYDATRQV